MGRRHVRVAAVLVTMAALAAPAWSGGGLSRALAQAEVASDHGEAAPVGARSGGQAGAAAPGVTGATAATEPTAAPASTEPVVEKPSSAGENPAEQQAPSTEQEAPAAPGPTAGAAVAPATQVDVPRVGSPLRADTTQPQAPPTCVPLPVGTAGTAPGRISGGGVQGTTTADLRSFAHAYNIIRASNCLQPIPWSNFRYDPCLEDRLFWMAEDPSPDPLSAWGHMGSVRSDGVPSRGCDGNLAGGGGNTGATVAQKWWDSEAHRTSLYKPSYSGSVAGICIIFAMTHGDGNLPHETDSFVRSAARWVTC